MDVFVGYTPMSDIDELGKTLFEWEAIGDSSPAAIQCPSSKYELYRRVAAENLSVDDYILAEIGCVPTDKKFIAYATRMLKDNPQVGMFLMEPGIAICRRKVIEKWPTKKSHFYIPEHKQAYQLAGYEVEICKEAYSRRLSVS